MINISVSGHMWVCLLDKSVHPDAAWQAFSIKPFPDGKSSREWLQIPSDLHTKHTQDSLTAACLSFFLFAFHTNTNRADTHKKYMSACLPVFETCYWLDWWFKKKKKTYWIAFFSWIIRGQNMETLCFITA